MKNKYILSLVFLIVGVILLIFSLGMLNSAYNRWITGALIFMSVLIIGVTAKTISNELILNKYLESKKLKNIKPDKKRESYVKEKASSKTNLIVSSLLAIAVIVMFFTKLNYTVLIAIIIISIFMQSILNSLFYIYYDKKVKEKDYK